jgi:hypothetical protein
MHVFLGAVYKRRAVHYMSTQADQPKCEPFSFSFTGLQDTKNADNVAITQDLLRTHQLQMINHKFSQRWHLRLRQQQTQRVFIARRLLHPELNHILHQASRQRSSEFNQLHLLLC